MKTVLLVEDDAEDIEIMRLACRSADVPFTLKVAKDGPSAIDYLAGNGPYANRLLYPLPDLLFLDVKLPMLDGHQVLEWTREQFALRDLPVVMLTISDDPSDIKRAYELGVTSYLLKTTDLTLFSQAVRVILKYWLELHLTPA